jgi:AcrR family transcriptional regulator
MDETARRSGVSLQVVDNHFGSKQDLHRRPLKRYYAELGAAQTNLDAAVHTAGSAVYRGRRSAPPRV